MASDELINMTFDEQMQEMDKPEQQEYQPLYKMVANNKIAVSKKEGVLWAQRLMIAKKKMDVISREWDENVKTYLGYNKASSDNDKKDLTLRMEDADYENLLWANTNAINRETIMKLPHIELTPQSEQSEPYINALEHGLNNYLSQIGNNGINLKEKLKKADIGAQLTNRGIIRLDWNDIIDGDAVKADIRDIEQKLGNPDLTIKKIKELEGRLFALNEKLEESGMSGLQLTIVDPKNLFIDPNSQLETGLDADWMIERKVELKSVIQAKYGTEDGTVYAGDKSDVGGDDAEKYYEKQICGDESEMDKDGSMLTTTVYYIWDKLKKRVYLYEEGKWEYPLWVYEDPYGLMQFFPYFILNYNTSPYQNETLSECSYYLPIQHQINDVNNKMKQARDRAFNITLYDKRSAIEKKDLENITNGKVGYVGINVPEGKRITDVISSMPTFGLEQPLMDKSGLYATMQKMCSSDPTMRGEEYRTNTTNMAIEQYGSAKKITIGVRIDILINYYIRIAKEVLKIMLEKFTTDDWSKYCSPNETEFLMQNPIAYKDLDIIFAGDDTLEPTSVMKKQEAVQLSQIMGQFAGASPAIVVVMLKLMSRAFNEIVISPEDWEMIFQSIQSQMQQQQNQIQPIPQQQPIPVPEEAQQVPQEELINQAAGIM